eukprot:Clim_evm17s199 gene=Clim_evmTU17s199
MLPLREDILDKIHEERRRESQEIAGLKLEPIDYANIVFDQFVDSEEAKKNEDDMLFFVDAVHEVNPETNRPAVHVRRITAQNLPQKDDGRLEWRKSFYLNLLMHCYEFELVVAVCGKRKGKLDPLQIKRVETHPHHTYTRMDKKGTHNVMAYPDIYFRVDNFDEAFESVSVRGEEHLAIELVAHDALHQRKVSIFNGSLTFLQLREAFARKTGGAGFLPTLSLYSADDLCFLRLNGPHGRGSACVAAGDTATDPKAKSSTSWLGSLLTVTSSIKKEVVELNAFLVYVNLPWDLIIERILDKPQAEIIARLAVQHTAASLQ